MEKINLAAAIENSEYWIEKNHYDALKNKKNKSWTDCESEQEWLVKLHYLRSLKKEKKIESTKFNIYEQKLIIKWWEKFCH